MKLMMRSATLIGLLFLTFLLLAAAGSAHALTISVEYTPSDPILIADGGSTTFGLHFSDYDPILYDITSAHFTLKFANPDDPWQNAYDQARLYDNDDGQKVTSAWWGQFLDIADQDPVTMDLVVPTYRLADLDANSGADLFMEGNGLFSLVSATLTADAVESPAPVPEPAPLWLMAVGGLSLLLGYGPRRRFITTFRLSES